MKNVITSRLCTNNWLHFFLLIFIFFTVFNFKARGQACCPTNTLNISTGYNPNTGGLVGPVADDPRWTVSYISAQMRNDIITSGLTPVTTGNPAKIVPLHGGGWVGSTTANWITCMDWNSFTRTVPGILYDFTLRRQFTLCEAAVVTVNMNVAGDNCITSITVNGVNIFTHPICPVNTNYNTLTTVPTYSVFLAAGTYNIDVTVSEDNAAGNGAGMVMEGTLTSGPVNAFTSENTSCAGFPCFPTISGPTEVCVNNTITLTGVGTGGTWSSSNTAVGTISASGTAYGVSAGTTTITYTVCGKYDTHVVTVNPNPNITGDSVICVNEATTLGSSYGGGTWSSSNTAVGTVSYFGGILGGMGAGTTRISYILPNGCRNSKVITVNPLPAPITGITGICVTQSVTLSSTTPGGTWSSSNTSVATISSTGALMTGIYPGTSVITYMYPSTGCYVTTVVTVTPLPVISGSLLACKDVSTAFTSSTPGGTWSCTSPGVILPTGVFTGTGVGTSTVSYTLPSGCVATAVVTVNPQPSAIAGPTSMCVGDTIVLSNATPGGTWSSSNTSIATVGSVSGVVSGIADGTAIITYSIASTGCYTTKVITVNPLPVFTTALRVCYHSTRILTASPAGGTWSSGSPAIATVHLTSGWAAGYTVGTTEITYTAPTGCSVIGILTVNPLPDSAIIVSPDDAVICVGTTVTLVSTTPGLYWSSSNTSVATVGSSTGVVTGISGGGTWIYYVLHSTNCFRREYITVIDIPDHIVGDTFLCVGDIVTHTALPSAPGTWSSSATSVATVGSSSGIVMAAGVGTAIITYTPDSCGGPITKVVTVNVTPTTISGTLVVCEGDGATLTSSPGGGTWSSSPVGGGVISFPSPASGDYISSVAGTAAVTYAFATGCFTTATATVNPVPTAITGEHRICTGSTTTLNSTPSGGTWSSSSPDIMVDAVTGVVTGVNAGTAAVTYTNSFGCYATTVVTVYIMPAGITGLLSICEGGNTDLDNLVPGGVWSSSIPSVGTVDAISGVVDGISAGTTTITYSTGSGFCYTTVVVTVNPLPLILGDSTICTGVTDTLTSTIAGGTWVSGTPSVAGIDPSTGIITGITPGTTVITYTTIFGCIATKTITVNETPSAITGTISLCVGDITHLSSSPSGGTWTSSAPAVGTVDVSGVFTSLTAGTTIVSYTMASGCAAAVVITVNPLPAPIDGTFDVCMGSVTTLVSLTPGGTWTSADPGTATVDPASGDVTGVTPGTTTITYTLSTGCFATTVVTVLPLPSPIFGDTLLCVEFVGTLYDTTAGGTWSGGTIGVATIISVAPGSADILGGLSPGTATFTYTIPTGCFVTVTVTVNPLPDGIGGDLSICLGTSGTLTCSPAGGTWTSVTPGVATVDPVTGVVTSVSVGTTQVSYTLPTGCYQISTVNVLPMPTAISGIPQLCIGDTATLYSTPTGGYWLSDAPWIASVDYATGLWTAMSGGTATITYVADIYAGCSTTLVVTVGPIVGPIVFYDTDDTLCVGDTTTLSHPTSGGVWESSDYGIATITPSGLYDVVITGTAPGTVIISYTVTDTCGITTVTRTITVSGPPVLSPISGSLGVCSGFTTNLSASPPGGTWSVSDPATASIDAMTGEVTGHVSGSVVVSYTLANSCGPATVTANVVVNMVPYITTNFIVACQTLPGPAGDGVPSDDPVISGSPCMLVCDSSIVRYYGNGVDSSTFTWDVYGGTIVADYGDSVDVLWTTVGLTGSVVLHGAFDHCIDSAIACVKIIDKPHASFYTLATDFCLKGNILFYNTSSGDPSSPIIYWHWDFGDGTSSSTSGNPEHAYSEAGTYTVTLTVKNQCNCMDSFKVVLNVSKNEAPQIACPSVVCDNEYAEYSTNARCNDFVWLAHGGTLFFDTSLSTSYDTVSLPDGLYTYVTGGMSSVRVRWDNAAPEGFGTISLLTPGCNRCDAPTTIKVPVILQNPAIEGPDTICVNTPVAYSLPLWPATDYDWGVLEHPEAVFMNCRDDYMTELSFATAGTYTVHARYQNRIKLCGGNVFKTITVLPPSSIVGPLSVCAGSEGLYTLSGGYSGEWEITDNTGAIVATSGGAVSSFAHTFSVPGTYLLNISGTFCAPSVTINVPDIPAFVDSLGGEDTVCLGRIYSYHAYNNIPGTVYEWDITGGILSPGSGTDVVTVVWTSTGTKEIKVRRVNVVEPHCAGSWLSMSVMHEIITLNVTGNVYPCANRSYTYNAGYTRGEVYDWNIYPNTTGSVISGNHSYNPSILWNNVSSATVATVVATVRKCDSVITDTLVITIAGTPALEIVSVSEDTICSGSATTITVTAGADSYTWDFGDGNVETTGANSVNWGYVNYTSSDIVRHVVITTSAGAGGCAPDGTASVDITVKPGPWVSAERLDTVTPCPGEIAILHAIASAPTGLSISSYSWTGANPSTTAYYFVTGPDGVTARVTASNGCTAISAYMPFTYDCDTGGPPCYIPGSISSNCGVISMSATTSSDGAWEPLGEYTVPTSNPGTVVYENPGVFSYRFQEFGGCRTYMLTTTVNAIPKIGVDVKCGTGGIDTLYFNDYSLTLPGVTYTAVWEGHDVGSPLITSLTPPYVLLPAGTEYVLRLTLVGTGTPDCYTEYSIHIPDALTIGFTIDTTPSCEKVPVRFTPVYTGSPRSYYWDFGDFSSLIKAVGEREYTFDPTAPPTNLRNVTLTVRDVKGCTDSHTETVEIYPNDLHGRLAGDTIACSADIPILLTYIPITGFPIERYEWSNGVTETTGTIGVAESGAYWVTVYDGHRCQQTRPSPVTHKLRVIQTPQAEIRGPQHYCVGDNVSLNGYAGDDVEYQWYRGGTPVTGWTNVYRAEFTVISTDVGPVNIELHVRTYDSVTLSYCETVDLKTIYVHPLPPNPVISGPTVLDCESYTLQLSASASVSGTFNWSNGTYGAENVINYGGPYRVWLTDLYGCKSHTDVNVPLDPDTYSPYFPKGCYELCKGQTPLTLLGPPCASFVTSSWNNSSGTLVSSAGGWLDPWAIVSDDSYYWKLNNGLCAKTIGVMDVTIVGCTKCQGTALAATLYCDTANPQNYNIDISFNTSFPDMNWTLGTDLGPITPFSGTAPTAGSYTLGLSYTKLETGPWPDSVTVQLMLTTEGGIRCYSKVRLPLDTCVWVAERQGATQTGQDHILVSDGQSGVTALLIYPNPASDGVQIQYDFGSPNGNARALSVFDVMGRKVAALQPQLMHGRWQLDVAGWSPGVYMVKMEEAGQMLHSQRMVVIH